MRKPKSREFWEALLAVVLVGGIGVAMVTFTLLLPHLGSEDKQLAAGTVVVLALVLALILIGMKMERAPYAEDLREDSAVNGLGDLARRIADPATREFAEWIARGVAEGLRREPRRDRWWQLALAILPVVLSVGAILLATWIWWVWRGQPR